MGYIRITMAVIAYALFLLIGLPVRLVLFILSKTDPEKKERIVYPFVRFGFRMVRFACGVKTTVIGRENLSASTPCLYIANHRSIFDIILGYIELPGRVSIVAKESVRKIPFLLYWMEQIHCMLLDRDSLEKGLEMINTATDLVRAGNSIFIFPEGTRCREEGTMLPFHGGSFKIATRTDIPIVPIAFVHTGDILEDHFPKVKARQITMVVGEPVETTAVLPRDRRKLPDQCRETIMQMLEAHAQDE